MLDVSYLTQDVIEYVLIFDEDETPNLNTAVINLAWR